MTAVVVACFSYPVVTVTRSYTTGGAQAQQHRFLLNPAAASNDTDISPYSYRWDIALTHSTQSARQRNNVPVTTWLYRQQPAGASTSLRSVSTTPNEWLLCNIDAEGVYRVNYDDRNWVLLTQQLQANHTVLSIRSRAQLIDDAFNLARAEMINQTKALDTTKYLSNELEYVPWESALSNTGYMSRMLSNSEAYGYFRAYMRQIIIPLYNRLGWNAVPNENILDTFNRENALSIACAYGYQPCIREATRQFEQWMANPTTNPIDPDQRALVYCQAVRHGTYRHWVFAWQQFRADSTDASHQSLLIYALSCSMQPWILNTYLNYSLNTDLIRAQDALIVIYYVSGSTVGRYVAWNFMQEHYGALLAAHGDTSFWGRLVGRLTLRFNTNYDLQQIQDFLSDKPPEALGTARLAWQRALEATRSNVKWMSANYAPILTWLKDNVVSLSNEQIRANALHLQRTAAATQDMDAFGLQGAAALLH